MQISEETNITICEIFLFEIDKSVESGDIKYIKEAIKNYGHLINKSYLEMANRIMLELVQEKLEDINL
jgi:hypothetical protein